MTNGMTNSMVFSVNNHCNHCKFVVEDEISEPIAMR